MSESEITFWATVAKVQTMADGGIRIYFDLGENTIDAAMVLMQYKRFGMVAQVSVKPKQDDEQVEQENDRTRQDNTRKIKY